MSYMGSLTGLRFLAAFGILVYHAKGSFGIPEGFTPLPLDNAVSFFFVLSGFILAHAYPSISNWGAARRFWIARIARIWPAHIICLIAAALLVGDLTGTPSSIELLPKLIANIFLLQAWIPDFRFIFSFNSVSWSISTEAFFYILFPLILLSFTMRPIATFALAAATTIIMILISSALHLGPYKGPQSGDLTATAMIYIHPLSRIFEFVLGIASYRLWQMYIRPSVDTYFGCSLLEVSALVVFILYLFYHPYLVHTAYMYSTWSTVEWISHSGTCFVSAFLIASFANGKGAIGRILSSKLVVLLGNISFSVYLTHQIILNAINIHMRNFELTKTMIGFAIYFTVVLIASYALWIFEKKAKDLILSLYNAHQAKELSITRIDYR